MSLAFDFGSVQTTEFGVGRDDADGPTYVLVPVGGDVQSALRQMAADTWMKLEGLGEAPAQYEPSEKYASNEYIYVALDHEYASRIRDLHTAVNLPTDVSALSDPSDVFCYFARMTDGHNRRLTALRRATQFKGVLKSRLIHILTDTLRLIEDRVFKLDSDFDLLVDDEWVHILRPSAFEFVGELQTAVLDAVPENIDAISADLPFVDFTPIAAYASKHPRAARYLASIRVQQETANINKAALKRTCKSTGVDVSESNGKLVIAEGDVMGFLEVLDRRRYELSLVKGSKECFRAGSRRRINVPAS